MSNWGKEAGKPREGKNGIPGGQCGKSQCGTAFSKTVRARKGGGRYGTTGAEGSGGTGGLQGSGGGSGSNRG